MRLNTEFSTDLGRFLGQQLGYTAAERPEFDISDGAEDGWAGVRRTEMVKICQKNKIPINADAPATEIRPMVRQRWLAGEFPVPTARDIVQEKVVETLKAMGIEPGSIPAPGPGPGRPRKTIAEPEPDPVPEPEPPAPKYRYYVKRGFGGYFVYDRDNGDTKIDEKHKSKAIAEAAAARMMAPYMAGTAG